MRVVATLVCVLAIVLSNARWLRVAQREHYLPGTVSSFVPRWWFGAPLNMVLAVLALLGLIVSVALPEAALLVGLVVCIGPIGLGLRGRTSKMAWTRRAKTLAVVTYVFDAICLIVGLLLGSGAFAAALIALIAPNIIDLAAVVTRPWEHRKAQKFVDEAKERLRRVKPQVVAITGSYGKTSTKGYVAHLLQGTKSFFATPASFNNRAGLSRSINEQLSPGTDIFIAEMGTYGPGEIRELCDFVPPNISVITAIGPVHLERFGSEDNIVKAKSEIFERASVCVLNVDDERLAEVADELEAEGKKVWRASAFDTQADVCVVPADGTFAIYDHGELIAEVAAPEGAPTNVACAVAVALELGVSREHIATHVATLPTAPHRQEVNKLDQGPTIIDDTYNANPASVRMGLDLLARSAGEGHRRILVTPGMVELGPRQSIENYQFAAQAAETVTDAILIGRTNRKALLAGFHESDVKVITVNHLSQAVDWVKTHVGEGDAVLYANDLPDHFP